MPGSPHGKLLWPTSVPQPAGPFGPPGGCKFSSDLSRKHFHSTTKHSHKGCQKRGYLGGFRQDSEMILAEKCKYCLMFGLSKRLTMKSSSHPEAGPWLWAGRWPGPVALGRPAASRRPGPETGPGRWPWPGNWAGLWPSLGRVERLVCFLV